METSVSSTTREVDEATEISSSLKLKLVKNGQKYYVAAHRNMENPGNDTGPDSAKSHPELTPLAAFVPNPWLLSQQISSSFQQSLTYSPLPLWPANYTRSGLVSAPLVNGQLVPFTQAVLGNVQGKDVNNQRDINVTNLTKTNGNSFPLLKNGFQQKANYYNINTNDNIKNNSINGSNVSNSSISYIVQSEPTSTAQHNSFNASHNTTEQKRSAKDPLIKQLLLKNSETNISYSARAPPPSIGSNPGPASYYLCVGCKLAGARTTAQNIANRDINCIKQTNSVSTQTDPIRKSNNQNNNNNNQNNQNNNQRQYFVNAQQVSACQMNRALRAYLIFANEMKSKLLYKERATTSLTPSEELDLEQRLRLMWNNISVNDKRNYLQKATNERYQDDYSSNPTSSTRQQYIIPSSPITKEVHKVLVLENKFEEHHDQVKAYVQNFISSKKQKLDHNPDETKQPTQQDNNYLDQETKTSIDNENEIIIEYESPSNGRPQTNSTTDNNHHLDELLTASKTHSKMSLFSNVEELARPYQSSPHTQKTTTITIATVGVTTTERLDPLKK